MKLQMKLYFYKNLQSTFLPIITKSVATLSPKILGNKQEAHIQGPWANLTKGAENYAPSTAQTRSKRANCVKAKPMVLPYTNPKMGFFELMIESQNSLRFSALAAANYSRVPTLIQCGLPKLERSFPEEQLPPLPVTMINLISGFSLAQEMRLLKLGYISGEKALYLVGRLNLIQNLLPCISVAILLFCALGSVLIAWSNLSLID